MSCVESKNLICKHSEETITFYVNLNWLQVGVTASNPSVSSEDPELDFGTPEVIEEDLLVDIPGECGDVQLYAGRAIAVQVGGGTPSDEETEVKVEFDTSNGDHRLRIARLSISGDEGSA